MTRVAVTLTERATAAVVDAVLDTDVPLVRLVDVEVAWSPVRLEAIRRFLAAGRSGSFPESCHWNWARKSLTFDETRHAVFSIETADEVQGLMWLWVRDYTARLAPDAGLPLVYVDYLEAAPWNAREYVATPRLKGIGTRLLEAAVLRSQYETFGGRVGLHALPQSEAFYAGACGMCSLGPDPTYHDLRYFEFTADAAAAFVKSKE
jgi:hypothetical protein